MKNVIISVFIMIVLLLIPNFSQATVDYTIDNSNMIINITGIDLDLSKTYQYTVVHQKENVTTATWYDLEEENYTTTTAKLELNVISSVVNNSSVYVYVKNVTDDTYVVEGYNVNLKNPIVKAIQVTSPKTGIYQEGQTVYISVYFDRKITGSIPTLKIRFGEGTERSLINGTIHNDTTVSTYGQYIQYSYNIQLGDNGYLTTTGLEGGSIKDINGNSAILSYPELTGSVSIEAKTSTTVIDDEESDNNQETNNNEEKKNQKDSTIASGKIPYTGLGYGLLIIGMIIILFIGSIAKIKYNKYKDI